MEIQTQEIEQRKKTMSMDFAERIMKIEQIISAHFNQPKKYQQTEFFKKMSADEKRDFENYLKNKKKMHRVMPFLLILPIIFLLFLNTSITGNTVKENIDGRLSLTIELILLSIVVIIFITFISLSISNRRLEKKIKKNFVLLTKRKPHK